MRSAEERHFTTHDGVELFYRHWPADGPPRGAIVMFHRGHEHSGRMAHLVDELKLPDFSFFAWDARGHGLSPGPRGDSPSIGASVRDVGTFIAHISQVHGIAERDIAIVAQSVGAVLAAAWVHDYAPNIRCQVLASPAFRVKLYVPLARPALGLWYALRGNFFVSSYVKASMLTRDPERVSSYERDPLIARPISANLLLSLHSLSERLVKDARAITLPTQILVSGDDWVVEHGPQHEFFVRLGAAEKERHVLPGFYHDTLGEIDRAPVIASVRDFLSRQFGPAQRGPDLQDLLLNADKIGETRDERDYLATPLPLTSASGLFWALARLGLRGCGLLSTGIALGHDTGFDSGATLDYVYRNEASGAGLIGKIVDRIYLEAVGWRGIRQRKRHIEELLLEAIEQLKARRSPVHIVDIAAGHGRYVLDAVSASTTAIDSILLRDYSPLNVSVGRRALYDRGFADIGRFLEGDAFDEEDLAALSPAPTIGIASGLYELSSDNTLVASSLRGLARSMAQGSYLIYTNQPWHPQLQLIARSLTSHRQGQPWIMRRRTQAEMDTLVARAGFRKVAQRVDEQGIFTVSLAERVAL